MKLLTASAPSRGLIGYVMLILVGVLFFSQPADAAPHRRRQSQPRGDKFILGVGKADITG